MRSPHNLKIFSQENLQILFSKRDLKVFSIENLRRIALENYQKEVSTEILTWEARDNLKLRSNKGFYWFFHLK